MFLLLILSLSVNSFSNQKPNIGRVIKEAENLALLQDRLMSCSTLYKAFKKAEGKDAKILKDKLFYFSKFYYTDKGFQEFLGGKELFEKERFQEAVDKLMDSDELEKGNTEVLHYLSLTYLWLKKGKQALEQATRSEEMNPLDVELVKDKLAAEVAGEDWVKAVVTADRVLKEFGDGSYLVHYFKGVSNLKLGKKTEAQRNLETALAKEKKFPETYYWLSEVFLPEQGENYLVKYNQICKEGGYLKNNRDPSICSHAKEKGI